MKGRRSKDKLVEFAQLVHLKIPHTKLNPGMFEDYWSEGLWVGSDMRLGENLIGTDTGVSAFRPFSESHCRNGGPTAGSYR